MTLAAHIMQQVAEILPMRHNELHFMSKSETPVTGAQPLQLRALMAVPSPACVEVLPIPSIICNDTSSNQNTHEGLVVEDNDHMHGRAQKQLGTL